MAQFADGSVSTGGATTATEETISIPDGAPAIDEIQNAAIIDAETIANTSLSLAATKLSDTQYTIGDTVVNATTVFLEYVGRGERYRAATLS